MNHTASILETLKKYLKAKGITYKQLAEKIGLSEASVKRLFSKQTLSLARLEEICGILDIDFYDLSLMDKQRNQGKTGNLTDEQEEALVEDPKLAIFLYFLINGWSVSMIIRQYEFTESEAVLMLQKLEKLGVLVHHPHNRVRLMITKNPYWKPGGPLWRANHQLLIDDFMDSEFGRPNENLVFSTGQFSEASLRKIHKKIDNLIKEYNQLAEMDCALPISNRYSTGLLIGFRPWVSKQIAELRRHSNLSS